MIEILLVDDNPSDVELTIHVLRQNKLANLIDVVEDGKEAPDFLFCRGKDEGRSLEDRSKVILLDLKLPEVGGLEVLRTIKKRSEDEFHSCRDPEFVERTKGSHRGI